MLQNDYKKIDKTCVQVCNILIVKNVHKNIFHIMYSILSMSVMDCTSKTTNICHRNHSLNEVDNYIQ